MGDFKGYPPSEYWEEKTLGWKRSGGERPLILAVEAALKKHFGEGASGKWQGSEDPRNGNTAFLKGIREALTFVLPSHSTPLDDEQRTAPLLQPPGTAIGQPLLWTLHHTIRPISWIF